MKSFNYIWRKILFSMTHWQGQSIRMWALRELGFTIGNQVYIGPGLTMVVGIADTSISLNIGDRVAFGPNVTLLLASHPSYSKLQRVVSHPTRKIVIGEDSWIGANSVVMPNVTIGKCCIVGAGAVVTHDVPDYSVVAGVPARLLKRIDSSLIR